MFFFCIKTTDGATVQWCCARSNCEWSCMRIHLPPAISSNESNEHPSSSLSSCMSCPLPPLPLCISPLPRIFMYVYCPQCRFYIIQMVKCLGDVSGLKNNGNNAWKRPANQLSLWANMFLYSIRHRVNCAVRNDCVEKCCPVFCFVACDRSLSIAFAFLTFSFYLRHGITMMPSYTAHNIYIHKQSKSRVSYCFSFFFYAVVVKRLLQYGKSVAKWSAVLVRCAMQ